MGFSLGFCLNPSCPWLDLAEVLAGLDMPALQGVWCQDALSSCCQLPATLWVLLVQKRGQGESQGPQQLATLGRLGCKAILTSLQLLLLAGVLLLLMCCNNNCCCRCCCCRCCCVCRLDLKKCHKELQTLEKALPLDGK